MREVYCGKYAGKEIVTKGFSLEQDIPFVLPDHVPAKLKPSVSRHVLMLASLTRVHPSPHFTWHCDF